MHFFMQLILPLCDTAKSGIEGDKRMNYCSLHEIFSNVYASMIKAISSYIHASNLVLIEDLTHSNSIICGHRCIEEGDSNLHCMGRV